MTRGFSQPKSDAMLLCFSLGEQSNMHAMPSRLIEGVVSAVLRFIPREWRNVRHEQRQKKCLKNMLMDSRFQKGFRSTEQLMNAIGEDRKTTERLLLAIKARRSENSDEWTLNPARKAAERSVN
jgi:hypothetical protein